MCKSHDNYTPKLEPDVDHFKGKTVPEHLKEAREKGARASEQIHGVELSGFLNAACDSMKETTIYLSILFLIAPKAIPIFGIILCIWKTGRASFLGWSRLNRLNQLIVEERLEIQNSRETEQKELMEIYRAKGFEPPLLDQVIQVLMADENRLLTVMLEEELGLRLEEYEHPLKQGFGAFSGSLAASIPLFIATFFSPFVFFGAVFILFLIATSVSILPQKRSFIAFNTWSLSLVFLVLLCTYELQKLLNPFFERLMGT
jgi:hypothetical protein